MITPFYDPMIAKIITRGPDRETALANMVAALDDTTVAGTTTNVRFLRALCVQPDFARGDVDTGLIERTLPELTAAVPVSDRIVAIAALAALGLERTVQTAGDPFGSLGPWLHWLPAKRVVHLDKTDRSHELAVHRLETNRWMVEGYRKEQTFGPVTLDIVRVQDGMMTFDCDGTIFSVRCVHYATSLVVISNGEPFAFSLPDLSGDDEETEGSSDRLFAPMPGMVKQIATGAGRTVEAGKPLIIMEAMKMELTLAAPRDGVVAEIAVAENDQVNEGDLLLALEPTEA